MRVAVMALGIAGCGRIAFDPQPECTLANVIESPYANSAEGADGATTDTAFLICTEAQLAQIAQHPEHQAGYFRIGADIRLTQPFLPIGDKTTYFVGAFDGGGHTIRGLSIDRPTEDNVGMFRYLGEGARVHDLTLADVDVRGADQTGALAGESWGTTLENISVSGMVRGDQGTGGVIGLLDTYSGAATDAPSLLANISATIVIEATGNSGGIIGILATDGGPVTQLSRLTVAGSVTGDTATGGAIGFFDNGRLEDSTSSATVHATDDSGGLVGSSFGTSEIIRSSATGDVRCDSYVCGGLAADETSLISHSFATGNVTCGDIYCAGLAADPYGPVEYSFATGTVTGTDYVGGLLAAPNSEDIHDCYATGDVIGRDYIGGLVGWQAGGGAITRSYATGRVAGRDVVGGLVGQAGYTNGTASVTASFAVGNVTGVSAGNRVSFMVALSVGAVTMNELYAAAAATCMNTAGTCAITSSPVDDVTTLYTSTSVPLATWDFTSVWREIPGDFPQLR